MCLRGFDEDDIQSALDILSAKGHLSNTRFTQSYIHSRRAKGYGPLRIHAELKARGIPEDIIEHHLVIADNAWFSEAQRVWRKRFKGSIPRDFKTRAQQMRFLQYRGFTSEHIEKLFHSDIEHA